MPVRFIALSDSLYACVCLCICLATASTRLAAGISQSRDRTCCLSGRRVAIVTLSASLRCFWETIPHQNQAVWVSATGLLFFLPSSLPVCFIPFFCLFSPPSSYWTQSEDSGCNCWPHSALCGRTKWEPGKSVYCPDSYTQAQTRYAKVLTSPRWFLALI